jgi:hypothetical protein
VQLLHSEPTPLSREQAAPLIEQLLQARKRAEVAERERKHLRSTASIEVLVDIGRPRSVQPAQAASGLDPLTGFAL